MRETIKFLATLLIGTAIFFPLDALSATDNTAKTQEKVDEKEPTTRSDAVIFKVHDIEPVEEEGIVRGCNYMVTLYNRTSINFRTFTLNLKWADAVDERFKFDRYVESLIGVDEAEKQKSLFSKDEVADKPVASSVTVNAFGADKQISLRSYIDSEKCYLMLSDASFSVTPCEIARNMGTSGNFEFGSKDNDCSPLFQFVSPKNPEYFGDFKRISVTEEAKQEAIAHNKELSDIDMVIEKIVENMGSSDKALSNVY